MKNIEQYKKRFYNLMESTMGDVKPLNEYVFKDYAVKGHHETGACTPSDDDIDEALLRDIKKAEEISGVKACITTAIDGHRPSGRHVPGHAVDIAMFGNDKGVCTSYRSEEDAKKKGIYNNIIKFVDALKSLGYNYNGADNANGNILGGDVKNIFGFGFPEHHHHVHVSNIENYKGDGCVNPKDKNCKPRKSSSNNTTSTNTSLDKEVLKNAKLCGWGNDVEGYKESGWKCPKPSKSQVRNDESIPTKPLTYYMREAQKLLNMPEEEQDGKFGKDSLKALQDLISQYS